MRVQILRSPRSRLEASLDLGPAATAEAAVRGLGLHPDAVLVVRGEDAIPIDAPLADGDRLKILAVYSGG